MRKEVVRIVILGHIDHGKSTLIGRLLIETDSLPREKITELKRISAELGKEVELAFLADQLKEEREQDKTIDTTQIFFKTRNRNFVIIDTPGHIELLKNMITGATQAEAAILLIDAHEGIMEQSRRHAYIISLLGIEKVIVVFNKMDIINYKEERFNELKIEIIAFLENLGLKPSFIVPISAKEGSNISGKNHKVTWYKGLSLLKALDLLKVNVKISGKSLIFPIQDIYTVNGERIIVGRIESGILKKGHEVLILPTHKEARINSIRVFGCHNRTEAQANENVGILLNNCLSVRRGEVLVSKENPPQPISRFKGNIFWISQESLRTNKIMTLRCSTQEVRCYAERIETRVNSSTLSIIEKNAKELRLNETGLVAFKTEKPIVAENFSFIEELGRFVLEEGHNLQGVGVITEKIIE